MIAFRKRDDKCPDGWQDRFVEILPEIEQHLSRAFRRLDPGAAEDAVEEGVIHCLLAFRRLHAADRLSTIRPANLAWYARLQIRVGREAACRQNSQEPLSPYARRRRGIRVEPLAANDDEAGNWIVAIVTDRRASIPDQVAVRLDFAEWFKAMPTRLADIAKDLAFGHSTAETARKYCLTAGRISQLRRELERSWREFQHENAPLATL